jgi:hypothetical protein
MSGSIAHDAAREHASGFLAHDAHRGSLMLVDANTLA